MTLKNGLSRVSSETPMTPFAAGGGASLEVVAVFLSQPTTRAQSRTSRRSGCFMGEKRTPGQHAESTPGGKLKSSLRGRSVGRVRCQQCGHLGERRRPRSAELVDDD